LIEAQVANKPIVTTDVGGVAEVTVPGKTAFLCKSGDIKTFSENVLLLVENDALRESTGKMGRDRAYSRFNYTRLVEETSELYWRLLNGKAKHL
jgi:glycosyltransferase involved in cell wall biosynthesis